MGGFSKDVRLQFQFVVYTIMTIVFGAEKDTVIGYTGPSRFPSIVVGK